MRLSKLNFPMSILQWINSKAQLKIQVLSIYNLNESRIDDMIQILYCITENMRLFDDQIENNILVYKDDYFTIIIERYDSFDYWRLKLDMQKRDKWNASQRNV